MGRKRMYKDINLAKETVLCIKGLVAEAERQRREGIQTDLGLRVQLAIDEAKKNLEHRVTKAMIEDIVMGVGYDRSRLSLMMSLHTYYRRRGRFLYDVAVGLGLK